MTLHDHFVRSFPQAYVMSEEDAAAVVAFLVTGEEKAPGGSSFAVTAGQVAGERYVWLSGESYTRMGFHSGFASKLSEANEVYLEGAQVSAPSWKRIAFVHVDGREMSC